MYTFIDWSLKIFGNCYIIWKNPNRFPCIIHYTPLWGKNCLSLFLYTSWMDVAVSHYSIIPFLLLLLLEKFNRSARLPAVGLIINATRVKLNLKSLWRKSNAPCGNLEATACLPEPLSALSEWLYITEKRTVGNESQTETRRLCVCLLWNFTSCQMRQLNGFKWPIHQEGNSKQRSP